MASSQLSDFLVALNSIVVKVIEDKIKELVDPYLTRIKTALNSLTGSQAADSTKLAELEQRIKALETKLQ